jgi:hypothetical protein
MGWALTAVVLSSVSLLVVALTMEQGSQALGHRSSMTVTGGRTLLLRILLFARTAAVSAGQHLGRAGRVAWREATASAVAVGHGVRARIHSAPQTRPVAAPRVRRRRVRGGQLRFEDCLQTTGPEPGRTVAGERTALSLTPAPSRGWLSRLAAAVELVFVIALAGGAIALTLIAAGWRASRIF